METYNVYHLFPSKATLLYENSYSSMLVGLMSAVQQASSLDKNFSRFENFKCLHATIISVIMV